MSCLWPLRGCDLQHARLEAQLRFKKIMLADSLQRSVPQIFNDRSLPVKKPLAAPAQVNNLAAVLMLVEDHGLDDPLTKTFSVNPPSLSYTPTIAQLESELILTWEAGAFCQVKLEQNSTLINLVLEMIGEGPHKNVPDFYCGYENFSLPAAKFAAAVLGIDSQNAAIRSAKRNALLNGVHNCLF